MHYFQFNIGDYASHTSRLTPLEDLAYRRMLDLYYLNEQPLNGCVTDVARELGLSEHVSEVDYVLGKFFTKTETGFSQKRIDLEIKKYKSNAKNKSKAGIASAKARAAKASSKLTGVEQVLNTSTTNDELNINQEPITKNQEPRTNNQVKEKPSANANEPFEIFSYWKDVMKKNDSAKFDAKRLKAVKDRLKDGYTVDQIKQAIYGCSVTPHNTGQNDQGKRFDCLELICRYGTNIERFAGNAQQAAPQKYSAVTERNINNIMDLELD